MSDIKLLRNTFRNGSNVDPRFIFAIDIVISCIVHFGAMILTSAASYIYIYIYKHSNLKIQT